MKANKIRRLKLCSVLIYLFTMKKDVNLSQILGKVCFIFTVTNFCCCALCNFLKNYIAVADLSLECYSMCIYTEQQLTFWIQAISSHEMLSFKQNCRVHGAVLCGERCYCSMYFGLVLRNAITLHVLLHCYFSLPYRNLKSFEMCLHPRSEWYNQDLNEE